MARLLTSICALHEPGPAFAAVLSTALDAANRIRFDPFATASFPKTSP